MKTPNKLRCKGRPGHWHTDNHAEMQYHTALHIMFCRVCDAEIEAEYILPHLVEVAPKFDYNLKDGKTSRL